jgi:hypothetical protein
MPTVWNETRYLQGDPGSYSTVARRSGNEWFWCCVNGPVSRSIKEKLVFLQKNVSYNATFYRDGEDGTVNVTSYLLDRSVTLRETVAGKSGISVRIKPASEIEKSTLKNYMPSFSEVTEHVYSEDQVVDIQFIHLNGHSPPEMELITNATFLKLDRKNGRLTGAPSNDDVGKYNATVRIKGDFFGLKEYKMNLTIVNVNDAPVITTAPQKFVKNNTLYKVIFEARDIDPTNDTLTWNFTTNAGFLTLYQTNATLMGRAIVTVKTKFWINISVSDGRGASDFLNYTLVVQKGINSLPDLNLGEHQQRVRNLNSVLEESGMNIHFGAPDKLLDRKQ